ncbi:MAG: SAM-dependent chlorinase/fluorinase [Magnetospirillum sp.]|nr:SAM-dependent chlorinase/fluorinase [Magnetospirillum sp.]
MIALFTDFGLDGPYTGQVKAVLHAMAPGVPVIDLLADAPACDPRSSAYLLAALVPEMPAGCVVLAVVDPGVGGPRPAVVIEVDGRLLVGPDNGLFEPLCRRGTAVRGWEIVWRPERLSATFHGRDLFAPVAARLAAGIDVEAAGCRPSDLPARPDWPDDLAAVIYCDRYGNAWTGIRAAALSATAVVTVGGAPIRHARTYGEVPPGTAFWYENSCGLAEIAINGGAADRTLGLGVGTPLVV